MTVFAALLLAAQPAPAAPDHTLLDTFRAACHRVDDYDAMKADAAGSGWEAVAEDADPGIGRLNRIGREAVGDDGTARGASFRRMLAGRSVFSRYEDRSGFWGNGCRLYDFDAAGTLPRATLDRWMGRSPTGEESLPEGGGHKHLWEPAGATALPSRSITCRRAARSSRASGSAATSPSPRPLEGFECRFDASTRAGSGLAARRRIRGRGAVP